MTDGFIQKLSLLASERIVDSGQKIAEDPGKQTGRYQNPQEVSETRFWHQRGKISPHKLAV